MNTNETQNRTLRDLAEQLLDDRREANNHVPADYAELIRALQERQHELQVHQVELELQNEQLAQANLELDEARREYQALFDAAPVGYLMVDASGVIARANLTLGEQLGVERARLLCKRLCAFVAPAGVSSFALFLRRVFDTPDPQAPVKRTVELPLLGANGARLIAQIEGLAVPREETRPAQGRLTVTDITPQREAQEEVLRLNATLEERVERRTKHIRELSDELETFVYSVTHDLLTPLRHIRGFTGLLARHLGPGDAQQERYVQHVEHSVDRMEQLLRALLDFFRTGQQQIRFGEVDLNRVIAEVRKDLSAELEGREVVFVGDPLPLVHGDSVALQLAFANLLGNALKFTRGREPARIALRAYESEREFIVGVEDNGAGFNMRQKDRLFGVFQRLHAERDFEGTGVGLALVRRIVHRHGGRVWAEGKPGQGATFWVSLPKSLEARD